MDIREWSENQKKRKLGKYRAQKVELDGFVFDSKAEARYWQELKLRGDNALMRNKVSRVVVHPGFDLGSCYYKADFAFDEWTPDPDGLDQFDDWKPVVVDIKGVLTRDCAIKLKLMREKYGIDVRVLTEKTDPRLFRKG